MPRCHRFGETLGEDASRGHQSSSCRWMKVRTLPSGMETFACSGDKTKAEKTGQRIVPAEEGIEGKLEQCVCPGTPAEERIISVLKPSVCLRL